MTKKIDFYFDFISPYSFLAHKKIINLNDRSKFNYKAILLGGLHNLSGILAKFQLKRPARRAVTFLLYDHIGGVNTMLHTLSNQACLVTVQQREPSHVMRIISQYKVQVLPASPTFLNLILLSEVWKQYNLKTLALIQKNHRLSNLPIDLLMRCSSSRCDSQDFLCRLQRYHRLDLHNPARSMEPAPGPKC